MGNKKKNKRDSSRILKKEKDKGIQEENLPKEKTPKIGSQVFAPQVTQEDSQFYETKAVEKYERWIGNGRKNLAGNVVEPLAIKDGFESIMSNFAFVGWQNLLITHEEFFPELV